MSASRYRLQIIDTLTGHVALGWRPGDQVESDLIGDLVERTRALGVGLGRTEAHVLADVRQAFAELIHDLKRRV